MGLHKIIKIIMAILAIAGAAMAAYIWTLDENALQETLKANGIEAVDAPMIDNIMNLSWVILAIILITLLVFVLKGLIFGGNAKNTLIGVGAFLVIIIVSYFLAPSDGPQALADAVVKNLKDNDKLESLTSAELVETTQSTIKWVGASLNAFYILATIAIGTMLYSGVKKLIK